MVNVSAHSELIDSSSDEEHLQRLVASWSILADFCFADLLLVRRDHAERFIVAAHVRPTTGQTLYQQDLIGSPVTVADRPLVGDTFVNGVAHDANVQSFGELVPVRAHTTPVCRGGRVIAVLLREESLEAPRRPGRLERTYLQISERLEHMVAHGLFPFDEEVDHGETPRVGDGVLVLDDNRRVTYASPNATSALHRLNIRVNAEGRTLGELGLNATLVAQAWTGRHPVVGEVERATDRPIAKGLGVKQLVTTPGTGVGEPSESQARVAVLLRCIPLLDSMAGVDSVSVRGAVVLLRDVTDLRRRDRLLRSKDATIREVHHRVKNNLQTISALLRLQGRRLQSVEAKQAIEESVRRIRSIALVHETLSRDTRETVPFDEVIRPLVRIVEEGLQGNDRPVRFDVTGHVGDLPAEIATPLAVVLVELLQNAVEHGFPDGRVGRVRVEMGNEGGELRAVVADNGVGFPDGFSLTAADSLGLTIVRTLITSELGGVIATRNDGGAVVEVRVRSTSEPRVGR